MRALFKLFCLTGLLLCLSACYHPDIDQGNHYSTETVQSLSIGMQKTAVIELLGNPLLNSPFDPNQLTYVYYNYPNRGKITQQYLNLTFKDDILVNIQNETQ